MSHFVERIKQDAKYAVLLRTYFRRVYMEPQSVCFYIVSVLMTDCPASQFCLPGLDVHSDSSALRRVSRSDPQSLDVRTPVHFLQVGETQKAFERQHMFGRSSHRCITGAFYESLWILHSESQTHLGSCGLWWSCMQKNTVINIYKYTGRFHSVLPTCITLCTGNFPGFFSVCFPRLLFH